MGRDQARRLTDRIKLLCTEMQEHFDKLVMLITEARDGGAAAGLGYRSWTAYLVGEGIHIHWNDVDERRQLVSTMAAEGASTRAIAAVARVDNSTVSRDLHRTVEDAPGVADATPGGAALADQVAVDLGVGVDGLSGLQSAVSDSVEEVIEETRPWPAIIGLDGKTYQPTPQQKPRRRSPLPEALFRASFDLTKRMITVTNLTKDDRFGGHRDNLVRELSELIRVRRALDEAIGRWDPAMVARLEGGDE